MGSQGGFVGLWRSEQQAQRLVDDFPNSRQLLLQASTGQMASSACGRARKLGSSGVLAEESDDPRSQCLGDGSRLGLDLQLAVDVFEVEGGGPPTDAQMLGDFLHGLIHGELLKYLDLASG